jgi:hypothetical protein
MTVLQVALRLPFNTMADLAGYYPFVLNMECSSVGYRHRRWRNSFCHFKTFPLLK